MGRPALCINETSSKTAEPQKLVVRTLGRVRAEFAGKDIGRRMCRSALALLVYCACKPGQTLSRDLIAHDLWGHLPVERARKAMNTAVWRLRRTISSCDQSPDDILDSTADTFGIRSDVRINSDVDSLERMCNVLQQKSNDEMNGITMSDVKRVADLYRGDFMQGFDNEWCFLPREALRAKYACLQEYLIGAAVLEKDWPAAIRHAEAALNSDPLREPVYEQLIRAHIRLGNRLQAKRVYDQCASLLSSELGVMPAREIREALLRGCSTEDRDAHSREHGPTSLL